MQYDSNPDRSIVETYQPNPDFLGEEATAEAMSRRKFLRIVTYATTYLIAEEVAGDLMWDNGSAKIHTLHNQEAQRLHPDTQGLVMGGFGQSKAKVKRIAESVEPALAKMGQISYLETSNRGLDMAEEQATILDFANKTGAKKIFLYLSSMAGMKGVEHIPTLAANGLDVTAAYFDCSPEGRYDLRDQEKTLARILSFFKRQLGYSGGPTFRIGIETANRIGDGRDDYSQIISEVLGKLSSRECSNQLLVDTADYIINYDSSKFTKGIPPTMRAAHLHPKRPSSDRIINNVTAPENWENSLQRLEPMDYGGLRSTVARVAIKGGAHANPYGRPVEYRNALVDVSKASGLLAA